MYIKSINTSKPVISVDLCKIMEAIDLFSSHLSPLLIYIYIKLFETDVLF